MEVAPTAVPPVCRILDYGKWGRESTDPEVARAQINHIAERLSDIAVVERAPEMEGRGMYAILARGKPREGAPRQQPVHAQQRSEAAQAPTTAA